MIEREYQVGDRVKYLLNTPPYVGIGAEGEIIEIVDGETRVLFDDPRWHRKDQGGGNMDDDWWHIPPTQMELISITPPMSPEELNNGLAKMQSLIDDTKKFDHFKMHLNNFSGSCEFWMTTWLRCIPLEHRESVLDSWLNHVNTQDLLDGAASEVRIRT